MTYYMDPVSYTALHPCDRVGAMRQSGGVAVGHQNQLPGVVHPQQQFYPSQPLYHQDIPLQEVPNGHDMSPTDVRSSQALCERMVVIERRQGTTGKGRSGRQRDSKGGGDN
ncbi:hypothetical protein Q5P01_009991 [Channa striata]|uniref:Uncharacterized protein n=1 Tax=Channa striata TaxID=64152 RepID=A0AA88MXV3_CHASR|nr:hypothetical protein Q5P01_009991 [Channa striata]